MILKAALAILLIARISANRTAPPPSPDLVSSLW